MLYLILSIIAVGVLLCSEPGKKLLSGGIGLLTLGVILVLVVGGGWLIIANFHELVLIVIGAALFLGFIGGVGYICNWSEQKIKKLGGYPEDDKQIPWYKPAPSSIVLFFIILISILFYFAFKYMTR